MNRYPPPAQTSSERTEAVEAKVLSEPAERIHPVARLIMASMGAVLVLLLGIAAWLTPNAAGYGTHRQLQIPLLGIGEDNSLPPCSFLVATGKPCPSCGMTTSWAYLLDARPLDSAKANLGGMLLGVCAIVAGPWLLISGVRGRFFLGFPSEWMILAVGLSLFVVTVGNWIYRLVT